MPYVVFQTEWGLASIRGQGRRVQHVCLPQSSGLAVEQVLLKTGSTHHDPAFMPDLQRAIRKYFEGHPVDFAQFELALTGFGTFARKVVETCRSVGYGRTLTYGGLACRAGFPKAARAVGAVMRCNPLPLLVPCHRIVRADGTLGGFSAPGGLALKQRMLVLEEAIAPDRPTGQEHRRTLCR